MTVNLVNTFIFLTITSALNPVTVAQVIQRPILLNTKYVPNRLNTPLFLRPNQINTNNGPLRVLQPLNKPNWFYTQQNLHPPNTNHIMNSVQLGNRGLHGVNLLPGQRPGSSYYTRTTPVIPLQPAVQTYRRLLIPTQAPFTNPTGSYPDSTEKPNFLEETTNLNSSETNHNDGQDTEFDIDIRMGIPT